MFAVFVCLLRVFVPSKSYKSCGNPKAKSEIPNVRNLDEESLVRKMQSTEVTTCKEIETKLMEIISRNLGSKN